MTINGISRIFNNKILSLIVIIALAIFIRIISFCGYYGSDDGTYAELSHKMAIGKFDVDKFVGAPVFPLRIGLIAPTAFAFKAFGTGENSLLIYPFMLSILGIMLAFLIAKAFAGENAGLLAASVMAILPIDARSATLLLPDLAAAFWANLSIYLIYIASRKQRVRIRFLFGSLAGIALGFSWLCKESVIFLMPFLIFYSISLIKLEKNNINILIGIALSLFIIILSESIVYYFHTGDFLFRVHQTERNYEIAKMWFFSEGSPFGWQPGAYWAGLAKRLFVSGPKIIFLSRSLSLLNLIALGVSVYFIITRNKKYQILTLWFLSLLILFNFGTSSVISYRPLALFDRYIYPMLLPAVILTAIISLDFMTAINKNDKLIYIRKPVWGYLILIGFTIVSLWTISRYVKAGKGSPVERKITKILSPADKLYTDSRTAWVLEFFWKYPRSASISDFSGLDKQDIPELSYVLLNRDRADHIHSTYNYDLPKFYDNVPGNWILKWSDARAEMYFIPGSPR